MVMATLAWAAPEASSVRALIAMSKGRIFPLASRPFTKERQLAALLLSVPDIQYARNPAFVPVARTCIVNASRGAIKAARRPTGVAALTFSRAQRPRLHPCMERR